jgi:hypothetical protein
MNSSTLKDLKIYLRPHRILMILFMLATLSAFCFGYGLAAVERGKSLAFLDFTKFYLSAQAFLEGDDIYKAIDLEELGSLPEGLKVDQDKIHANLNMPIVTLIFLPFLATTISAGMVMWVAVSIGFIFISAWLFGDELIRKGNLPRHMHWMIAGFIAILLLLYFPTFAGAILGQLGQLLLLILCGAWIAARRGHNRVGGVLFGVALSLKPFTGIFLIVLPWLRRWDLMRWYIGSFAAISVLGAIVFGPRIYLRYLSVLQEVDWYGFGWNASFMGTLSILFGGNAESHWLDLPRLAQLVSVALSLALYLQLVNWVCRTGDPTVRLDVAVAGSIPLMLLASPLGWLYYFPTLWITAFAVVLAAWTLRSRVLWWALTLTLLVLSGIPQEFVSSADSGKSLWMVLKTSRDTGTLLAAIALVAGVAWRLNKTPDISVEKLQKPSRSASQHAEYTRVHC